MKVIGEIQDIRTIDSLSLGLLSKKAILHMSVCEILNSKKNGENSIYDLRLGSIDNSNCTTCNLSALECSGHFGHIQFVIPILHPFFYSRVENILRCFCWNCHSPLFDISQFINFSKELKFQKIYEKIKKSNKNCHVCSFENGSLKIIDGFPIYNDKKVSFDELFELINTISEHALNKIVDIKQFMIEVLPVIPTCCRPQLKTEDIVCDDDLTIQYIEIVKNNNNLKDKNISEEKKNKYHSILIFRVTTLFNNSFQKAKHTTNAKSIKSIIERLAGKEGQIRNNALGKRTELSSRTVISPDPTLKLNEVRIPREIAEILTFPELVTPFNFNVLNKLVNIDKKVKYVKRKNGPEIDVRRFIFSQGTQLLNGDIVIELKDGLKIHQDFQSFDKKQISKISKIIRNDKEIDFIQKSERFFKIEIGDTVFRELRDGDRVNINRCPSLHKNSFQGVIILISDTQKTISFNLGICKSMNADFDGDENNLWSLYDYKSVAEVQEIMDPEKNIIVASSGKNIVVISQDSLISAYLMTKENKKIEKKFFFDIISEVNGIDYLKEIQRVRRVLKQEKQKAQAFNGRGLFSMILPKDFFYELESLKIKEGVIYEGFLDNNTLGSSVKSIIYVLNRDYNYKIAANFINHTHFITNKWLSFNGLTVSLKDCIPINSILYTNINEIIINSCEEILITKKIISQENIREIKVNFIINKIKEQGLKLTKENLNKNNNFINIINSGSKGNIVNITQISGLVGQQNIETGRIPLQINNRTRSLVFLPKKNKNILQEITERGFVSSSYVNGLTPHELYFTAIAGREAICQTAMGTSVSGYSQRRIGKLMEDLTVSYDGTVRNRNNKIISFDYNDGFDCTKSKDFNIDNMINKLNFNYEKKY